MIKTILKRHFLRTFMTILVIMSVLAIIKTSWLHQVFEDIAAGACLLGSYLCARAIWPCAARVEDVPTVKTPAIAMPTVPESVTETLASIWPDGDVVERILIEQQREQQEQELLRRLGPDDDDDGEETVEV